MLTIKYSFILRGEINLTEKDKELIKKLNISKDKILWNETMKNYTTFKIGGEAECLIKIDNEKTLAEILQIAKENNIPLTILGNGSNVLISDEGVEGIVLLMQFQDVQILFQLGRVHCYVPKVWLYCWEVQ